MQSSGIPAAGVFTSTHFTVSFVLEIAPGATCRCSTGGSRVWNDVLWSTVFHFHEYEPTATVAGSGVRLDI